jgi:hypothetical protein
MTVQEAAREYYGKGFSIIPLNIDKTPAVTGWKEYQEAKPPEELIKKWWVNGSGPGIGIITGKLSGVVVVDVDDKDNGFKNLAKYISPGIITPMAKTPTGGYHLYFKHPGRFIGNKRNAALGFRVMVVMLLLLLPMLNMIKKESSSPVITSGSRVLKM